MVMKGPGFTNGIIILDEPEAVYYSGQVVSGNVHFELNGTIAYSALNLMYLGEALVQRIEKQHEMSGGRNRFKNVKYEGREQYFNLVQCVLGGAGTTSTLPAGVHSFPFQFQVPFNAPSSFKEEDGTILYRITAYLQYPEPKKREELVKEFQVVAPLSPDTLATVRRPLELHFEDIETCSCFCASNPIKLKVVLPSGALAVGSVIPIDVKVQNNSSIEIYELLFRITKRHTYRTHVPRSESTTPEQTVAELKRGPVLSDTRREYRWELPLPPAALPNLQQCGIIDVEYLFKVKIRMTGCNEPVEEEAEVFIGVLPQSDPSAVTSPELAAQLPKAPLPDPSNQPIGLNLPGPNHPPNTHTQQHDPQMPQVVSTPLENTQKSAYEIGFIKTVSSVPTQPPYPGSGSGYPYPGVPPTGSSPGYPYPGVPPAAGYPYPSLPPAGGSPYLNRPPAYNPNSSQQNIAAAPSAPPL